MAASSFVTVPRTTRRQPARNGPSRWLATAMPTSAACAGSAMSPPWSVATSPVPMATRSGPPIDGETYHGATPTSRGPDQTASTASLIVAPVLPPPLSDPGPLDRRAVGAELIPRRPQLAQPARVIDVRHPQAGLPACTSVHCRRLARVLGATNWSGSRASTADVHRLVRPGRRRRRVPGEQPVAQGWPRRAVQLTAGQCCFDRGGERGARRPPDTSTIHSDHPPTPQHGVRCRSPRSAARTSLLR